MAHKFKHVLYICFSEHIVLYSRGGGVILYLGKYSSDITKTL